MALAVVGEEEELPQGLLAAYATVDAPAPPRAPRPLLPAPEIMTGLQAMASLLTVRLVLFMAVIAAGGLTYMAMQTGTANALWGCGLFNGMVVLPLVALASRRMK